MQRWRYSPLLPVAAVVGVFVIGQIVSALLFADSPALRSVSLLKDAPFADYLGLELAARQRMITMTFLLVMATAILVFIAISALRHVWAEHNSSNPTNIDRQDFIIGGSALAVVISLVVVASVFSRVHCGGGNYVYYCLGQNVHPGMIQAFLTLAEPSIDAKYAENILRRAVDYGTLAAIVAAGAMLAALLMLPRGLENVSTDRTLTIDELVTWYHDRLNRLNTLSLVAVLVLVAAIAQMSTWLGWPVPLMSKELVTAGDKLNAGYSDIAKSLLQFHGVWFSIIVAALIIPTKLVITEKCRAYLSNMPKETPPNPRATKLQEELSVGTDLKTVFDRYRSYLLILAPPLAQQVLQTIPQAS
jgi:hypothetical protein